MAELDAIESLTTLRHGREGRAHGDAVNGAILFDGTRLPQARQRWSRGGYRWRAGIEGRISGLKRRYGLDRCREHLPHDHPIDP